LQLSHRVIIGMERAAFGTTGRLCPEAVRQDGQAELTEAAVRDSEEQGRLAVVHACSLASELML